MFRRIGRAMLRFESAVVAVTFLVFFLLLFVGLCCLLRCARRPLYDQCSNKSGSLSNELVRTLQWWLAVLRLGVSEQRSWQESEADAIHVFCDASGSPPCIAALCFVDGTCRYAVMDHAELADVMLQWSVLFALLIFFFFPGLVHLRRVCAVLLFSCLFAASAGARTGR